MFCFLSYYKEMDEEAGYHYGRKNVYGCRRSPNYCGPPPPVTRWKRRGESANNSEFSQRPVRNISQIQHTRHTSDITRDSNVNPLDVALGLNSSRTSPSRFPYHQNLESDIRNQMSTDGSVYTIIPTSAAIHRPIQHTTFRYEGHHNPPHQHHNTTQYPIRFPDTNAVVQSNSSQIVNEVVRPATPPPSYGECIFGETSI